jgi:hypothetical protein
MHLEKQKDFWIQIAKICSGYKCKGDVQASIKPKRHKNLRSDEVSFCTFILNT